MNTSVILFLTCSIFSFLAQSAFSAEKAVHDPLTIAALGRFGIGLLKPIGWHTTNEVDVNDGVTIFSMSPESNARLRNGGLFVMAQTNCGGIGLSAQEFGTVWVNQFSNKSNFQITRTDSKNYWFFGYEERTNDHTQSYLCKVLLPKGSDSMLFFSFRYRKENVDLEAIGKRVLGGMTIFDYEFHYSFWWDENFRDTSESPPQKPWSSDSKIPSNGNWKRGIEL